VASPAPEKKSPAKTVSLSGLLKTSSKKEETSAHPKPVDQPFSEEQLSVLWNEYAEQRKKFQAEYQMLSQPFELRGNLIVVTLLSPVHDTMLNSIKAELAAFLRERLKNNTIQIAGELKIAGDDDKKIYYTARDKFDYLVEKNPVLREMKDRLGLDPDF
jgi:DNA polymerase-3 subunit gamma/tau